MYQIPSLGRVYFYFFLFITQNEVELVSLAVSGLCRITWELSSKISLEEQHGVNTGCQPKTDTKDPFALTNKPTVKRLNHVVEITRI